MGQRVCPRIVAAVSPVLLGVWSVVLLLTGSGPVSAGQVAAPVSVVPAAPVRSESVQRSTTARPEIRRAPTAPTAVVATDRERSGPAHSLSPELAAPVAFAAPPVLGGRIAAQPRQGRAPPQPAHEPRQSRAPPHSTSS
ncbi:hypothetical protein ABT354_25730 [Streptomyces sp. NPDC000594]|uniref:hypothetical protein n=1 Tax=Streptomyces sp. NPDC000594 TaxID=3154261 RepID=UPI003332C38E